jgi:hypothetical protein
VSTKEIPSLIERINLHNDEQCGGGVANVPWADNAQSVRQDRNSRKLVQVEGRASLLLAEAGREEAHQGSLGAKAYRKKDSQRSRMKHHWRTTSSSEL